MLLNAYLKEGAAHMDSADKKHITPTAGLCRYQFAMASEWCSRSVLAGVGGVRRCRGKLIATRPLALVLVPLLRLRFCGLDRGVSELGNAAAPHDGTAIALVAGCRFGRRREERGWSCGGGGAGAGGVVKHPAFNRA